MVSIVAFFSAIALAEAPQVQIEHTASYAIDTVAYAAGHRVQVRQRPGLDAAALATLELGTQVTVSEEVEAGAPWVPVRTADGLEGFVFGTLLTAAALEADLDDDGDLEQAMAHFDDELGVVVQVVDGDRRLRLRLDPAGDIEGPKDRLLLSTVDSWEAGIPMIRVERPGREMCGSGDDVSYISVGAHGLKDAVQESTWSDTPFYSHVSVQFQPVARTAVRTAVRGDHEMDEHTVEVEILELVDGVFEVRKDARLELAP